MAKLLFASKDTGSADMGVPLAEVAREKGHEVMVAVEGLAIKRYQEKGFAPIFEGTVDFRDKPFPFDGKAILEKTNPDAVIVTMSSPINIEDLLGEAANERGIPLVAVSNFWGSLTRAKKGKADLMLVIDELDAGTAYGYFRHGFRAAVVGNHAIRRLRELTISWNLITQMGDLKRTYGKVILFAGGNATYTTPTISLLVECLKRTSGDWVVIKRYHPKEAERKAPDNRTWSEVWDENFAALGKRTVTLPTKEADAVAVLSDITVAGFSTLMISAIGSLKPAVALVTPEATASLKAQTALARHPLAEWGLMPEVHSPQDLSQFFGARPEPALVDRVLKPYDPELALAEIESLIG